MVELREELTLQLAIVTDQKGAKIVSLIEELRRESGITSVQITFHAARRAGPHRSQYP